MIIRIFNFIVFTICCTTAYGLFMIKDRARTYYYQINELNKQILEEQDKIHILKAEMAYLTSPEILKLSAKHLDLNVILSNQIIENPLTQGTQHENKVQYAETNHTLKNRVKWHYKKNPSKYIQRVVAGHNR